MDQPGADWLINAVNPFPDYRSTPAGVPSLGVSVSAVKTLQKTMTITKPATLPAGSKWDAFVFTSPMDNAAVPAFPLSEAFYCSYDRAGYTTGLVAFGAAATPAGMGVLNCFTVASGGNPIPWSTTAVLTAEKHSINMADAWAGQGTFRLASFGYEIVDVTPALYRGGTMVSFRQEVNEIRTVVPVVGTTAVTNTHALSFYTGLPDTYAQCLRIPGSVQWNVEEGAYVVCTFNTDMERFECPISYEGAVMGTNTLGVAAATNGVYMGANPGVNQYNTAKTHLDMSGNYLKGLDENAVITITFHAVLEIIPNVNSVMIDFIKPTTTYNPELLQVYARAKADLPAASVKADNDAGDAFKKILGVLAPVLSAVFPAFSPLIQGGATLLSGVTTAVQERRKKKREAQASNAKASPPPKGNINNTTNGKLNTPSRLRAKANKRKR